MFNLIMGGEPDYFEHWPMYERVSGSCDFPISRMLEGTSDDIRLKLTPLNDKALSYIEKLPTLLCQNFIPETMLNTLLCDLV